jgi:hypothetical protein
LRIEKATRLLKLPGKAFTKVRSSRSLQLGLCLSSLIFLYGCGGSVEDKIGNTIPVSGKVTIDDHPLAAGTVNFVPDEAKQNKSQITGFGMIKDGEYSLSCGTAELTKPGVPPGWYKVIIQTTVPVGMAQTTIKPGSTMPETVPAAAIAAKFTDAKHTTLEIEVKEGGGPYDLKATSK